MPLAPSEAECAPLTWNMALHFLRSLIQYGVLRVATADNEVSSCCRATRRQLCQRTRLTARA